MKSSKVLVAALVTASVVCLGSLGCRSSEKKEEHPKAEHPTTEQPAKEHPATEHPSAEHPK